MCAPAEQAAMACEETKLILHGLGGELCTIAARPDWAVHEVKAAVEAEIQVQPRQQRLLLGTRELRDADRLSDLGLGWDTCRGGGGPGGREIW